MDWKTILQAQQTDFINRLKSGDLLQCNQPGKHSELTVITGDSLQQLRRFCWRMVDIYRRSNSKSEDVFVNNMKGKLGEEVVKTRLGDLLTDVDYEEYQDGDGGVDFTLAADSSIGIQVKARQGKFDQIEWSISEKEINKNAVLVCILIQEEVNEAQNQYHLVLAGFLPTNMTTVTGGKARVKINQLLYCGGLRGYLESLTVSPNARFYFNRGGTPLVLEYERSTNHEGYTLHIFAVKNTADGSKDQIAYTVHKDTGVFAGFIDASNIEVFYFDSPWGEYMQKYLTSRGLLSTTTVVKAPAVEVKEEEVVSPPAVEPVVNDKLEFVVVDDDKVCIGGHEFLLLPQGEEILDSEQILQGKLIAGELMLSIVAGPDHRLRSMWQTIATVDGEDLIFLPEEDRRNVVEIHDAAGYAAYFQERPDKFDTFVQCVAGIILPAPAPTPAPTPAILNVQDEDDEDDFGEGNGNLPKPEPNPSSNGGGNAALSDDLAAYLNTTPTVPSEVVVKNPSGGSTPVVNNSDPSDTRAGIIYRPQYLTEDQVEQFQEAIAAACLGSQQSSFKKEGYTYTCLGDYYWVFNSGKPRYLTTQPSGATISDTHKEWCTLWC
jgi:hypothetical protein